MLLTSGTLVNSPTAPAMSPTPQPPPETTTVRPSSGSPSARRASAGQRGSRNSAEISGRTSRTLPRPAMRSTEDIDSPYITRCTSMPGCAQKNRPVRSVIVATVGQRTTPRAPQPRQHDRDRRVGRDDHVGVVLGDRARQRTRAEQAQQPPRERANGQHVLEQPVDDRVGPREEAQLHAVAVLDHRPQQRPIAASPSMTVTSACCSDASICAGQRPRGRGVALADVGREDQHATWAGGVGDPAPVTFAVAASHRMYGPPTTPTTGRLVHANASTGNPPSGDGLV